MLKALESFVAVYAGLSPLADPEIERLYPNNLLDSRDPGADLAYAYSDVIKSIRGSLGIDPLTTETLRLFARGEGTEQGSPAQRVDQ